MSTRIAIRKLNTSIYAANTGRRLDVGNVLDPGANDFSFAAWIKPFGSPQLAAKMIVSKKAASTNGVPGFYIGSSSATVPFGRIVAVIDDGVSTVTKTSTNNCRIGEWNHVAVSFNRAGNLSIYINGVLDSVASIAAIGSCASPSNLRFMQDGSGNNQFYGNMTEIRMFSRVITAAEVLDLFSRGVAPTSGVSGEWLCQEGGGLTCYDTSGNGNNGTLTSAIFSLDTPTQSRKLFDGNLLVNGDFEYYPPFVAGLATSGRFIEGTSSGSTVNIFNWAIPTAAISASAAASIDPTVSHSGQASLKLDLLDTSGSIVVQSGTRNSPPLVADKPSLMVLLPNTQYTITAWIKTLNTRPNGAFFDFREYTGDLATVTTTSSTKLSGTSSNPAERDFIQVTMNVTTGATTRFGSVLVRHNVAGNVSTAWFDDISVVQTVLPTRTSAGSRLLVRDFGTCLNFNGTTSTVLVNKIAVGCEAAASSACWFKAADPNPADFQMLIQYGEGIPAAKRQGLALNNARRIIAFFYTGSVYVARSTGPQFYLPGVWYHAVQTWDGTNTKLYVNGVEVTTGTTAPQTDATNQIRIGKRLSTQGFTGNIDDVKVWTRTLTAAEVSDLYLRGVTPTDGLFTDLRFNEGSGSTANDSTGLGNSGTITAATYSADVCMIARTAV